MQRLVQELLFDRRSLLITCPRQTSIMASFATAGAPPPICSYGCLGDFEYEDQPQTHRRRAHTHSGRCGCKRAGAPTANKALQTNKDILSEALQQEIAAYENLATQPRRPRARGTTAGTQVKGRLVGFKRLMQELPQADVTAARRRAEEAQAVDARRVVLGPLGSNANDNVPVVQARRRF